MGTCEHNDYLEKGCQVSSRGSCSCSWDLGAVAERGGAGIPYMVCLRNSDHKAIGSFAVHWL